MTSTGLIRAVLYATPPRPARCICRAELTLIKPIVTVCIFRCRGSTPKRRSQTGYQRSLFSAPEIPSQSSSLILAARWPEVLKRASPVFDVFGAPAYSAFTYLHRRGECAIVYPFVDCRTRHIEQFADVRETYQHGRTNRCGLVLFLVLCARGARAALSCSICARSRTISWVAASRS